MKTSEIKFTIAVDDEHVPETIQWEATDSGMEGRRPCNATLLSIWDPSENTTLRIDLWTKHMPVDDMKRFFYENFISLADTYMRATSDEAAAKKIRMFADEFGKEAGLFSGKK